MTEVVENKPNRYDNGKIYSIRSNQTDMFYIGSTCLPLCKRLYGHKKRYQYYNEGRNGSNNYSSFDILKYDDCYIELLEDCPCNNKQQLLKREGELIRLHKNQVVNINGAGTGLTQNDYCKKWRNENKDYFYDYKKTKIKCVCGKDISRNNISYHKKNYCKGEPINDKIEMNLDN